MFPFNFVARRERTKGDIKNYIEWVTSTNIDMQRWKAEHKHLVIDVLTERADGL